MKVLAIRAWPGEVELRELELPAGSTVAAVRELLGWPEPQVAVFGARCTPDAVLQPGDRVEFLRELTADPKDSRRKRADANPLPRTHRAPRKGKDQTGQ